MGRFIRKIIIFLITLNEVTWAQGFILAVGGGREDYGDWSDEPYRWMVEKAQYGKIINIDVDAASDWYPAYFVHLGAAPSSRSRQIPDRHTANDETIYQELKSARGIFIEGGDQWDYVESWKNTLVQKAIREVYSSGGVIGGTSAGLAVLGEIVFDAKYGSARPEKAVYDGYIPQIHFETDFLNLLPNIITDSHFTMRGRIGRLVPMLARLHTENPGRNFTGLGIDENTAVCIDSNLIGKVFGEASVTVLYKTSSSKILCEPGKPPLFSDIGYDQMIEGAIYDFKTNQLIDGGNFLNQCAPPVAPTPFLEIMLDGNLNSDAEKGTIIIENIYSSPTAAFYANLSQNSGQNLIPNSVIMPKIWSESDYFENKWAGAQWGLATHPHFTAILIDEYNQVQIDKDGHLTTNGIVQILDGYGMTHAGLNSRGCQIPGIIGAKLHFLTTNEIYNLKNHALLPTKVNDEANRIPHSFELIKVFPQPFSDRCSFSISQPPTGKIEIKIYNLMGQVVRSFAGWRLKASKNLQILWDGKDDQGNKLPDGIYLAKIQVANEAKSIKILKAH